ncbi:MAG: hypothetical protein ACRDK7_04365 [Solirubrobacteraceae bacterium]
MGVDVAGRNIMGWTAGHLEGPDQSLEQRLLCEQYQVAPEGVWQLSQMRGQDGYERIDTVRARGWTAIPSWGLEGWDLGDWPLVVIFHRHSTDGFELAYDVEGDVTVYRYPTRELRDAATDRLAFWHWKHDGAQWVAGIGSIETAPERLRGRFSSRAR